jgi:hypothetical protein
MIAVSRQHNSKDDVDALAASIWAHVVLSQSNLPTFYALEKDLWLKRFGRTGRKLRIPAHAGHRFRSMPVHRSG